ncbi:MAG: DUF4190 domain-containing protein [Candidatus Pacearchaeota archaeon]
MKKGAVKKEAKQTSALAISSLVLSLIFFIPLLSVVAIILGIVALFKISKNKSLKGKGFAIAGIVIGVVVTIGYIIAAVAIITVFMPAINAANTLNPQEAMNFCLAEQSYVRDFCIFIALSSHIENLDAFDPAICDQYVSEGELKSMCNAILRNDKTYCEQITDPDSRMQCFGLLDELASQGS